MTNNKKFCRKHSIDSIIFYLISKLLISIKKIESEDENHMARLNPPPVNLLSGKITLI
mgnify:CR=1 FL=1